MAAQISLSQGEFIDLTYKHIDITQQYAEIRNDIHEHQNYGDNSSLILGWSFAFFGDFTNDYIVDMEGDEKMGMLGEGQMNLFTSFPLKIGNIDTRNNITIQNSILMLNFDEDQGSISMGSALISWELDFRYTSIRSGLIFEIPYEYTPEGESAPWYNRARFSNGYVSLGLYKLNVDTLFDLEVERLSYLNVDYTFEAQPYSFTPYISHLGIEDSYHPGLISTYETNLDGSLSGYGLLLTSDFSLELSPFLVDQASLRAELDITNFINQLADEPTEDMFIELGVSYLAEHEEYQNLMGWNLAFGRRPRKTKSHIIEAWFQFSYNDWTTLKQFNMANTSVFSLFMQESY